MGNKKYYWLKLKNDFFTNKKIKKLRKIAGGDTYTIIYLKMQLLSITNEGKLYFDNVEDSFADELALELDEDVENVKVTLMFLIKNGLLVEINCDEYLLPEAQDAIGKESASAERVRKHRELKQQQQKALQCNTEVTKSNIEIEKEKDIDIELEKKKDKEYFANAELNSLFLEFIEVRKKLKAVNSERAIKTLINKLNKYPDDVKYQMIENSIVNSWKDVYELKEKRTTSYQKPIRQEEVPEWINKEIKKEEMTQDELDEMDELLKPFTPNPELQERLKSKYGKKQSV
jgi:predicted phage replisome organizer